MTKAYSINRRWTHIDGLLLCMRTLNLGLLALSHGNWNVFESFRSICTIFNKHGLFTFILSSLESIITAVEHAHLEQGILLMVLQYSSRLILIITVDKVSSRMFMTFHLNWNFHHLLQTSKSDSQLVLTIHMQYSFSSIIIIIIIIIYFL